MSQRPISTVATMYGEGLGLHRPGRTQLVVVEGPDQGRAVDICEVEVVAGSDESTQLRLTDDRVSSRHVSVASDGVRFRVRDLDSRNGTWLEGARISAATVSVGATLKLGRSYLRIQPQPEPIEIAPSQSRRFGELVAESLVMREVFAVLELAAASEVTVLLEGETGTGKELAARAIHAASPRRSGPFVAVDCSALPDNLIESELFGHVRGAFTGATTDRAGVIARATGGTLFLDELDSIPLATQARLLRVLEERALRPVGGDRERSVDIRVVGAARHELESRIADGGFRSDLFYRLSVVRVVLPPLRRRREDIAPIVGELLRARGLVDGDVAGDGLDRLRAQEWRGNVRELRNVIDGAIALSPGARTFAELRLGVATGVEAEGGGLAVRTDLSFAEAKQRLLDVFERCYLRDVFERCQGNISATAREAGVDRKHLRARLRHHGLLE